MLIFRNYNWYKPRKFKQVHLTLFPRKLPENLLPHCGGAKINLRLCDEISQHYFQVD